MRRRLKEVKTYFHAFLGQPASRFIIFAQGRTGTWLLYHLLNLHPDIYCEKEILMYKVQWPWCYLTGRSCKKTGKTYGCHIQIDQLLNTQQVDPDLFLRRLVEAGWRVIYLKRQDIVRQSISGLIAAERQQWYSYQQKTVPDRRFVINPDELLQWLQRRAEHYALEADILRDIPHLVLTYETDLLDAANHQPTMDRIFDYLGLTSVPVKASTTRLGSDRLADTVANYAEIVERLQGSPFANYHRPC